jgi:hypothetical protein
LLEPKQASKSFRANFCAPKIEIKIKPSKPLFDAFL